VTSIGTAFAGQKFLTLPGGYVIWDSNWSDADRTDKMTSVLKDFLNNEAMLSQ
jgi:hypothetical protein